MTGLYGKPTGSTGSGFYQSNKAIGLTGDATKSGITGSVSISIPGNSYASMPCTYFIYST